MDRERKMKLKREINIMCSSWITALNIWNKDTVEHQKARDRLFDNFTNAIYSIVDRIIASARDTVDHNGIKDKNGNTISHFSYKTDGITVYPKLPEKMPIGFEPDDQYELGLAIRINSIIDYLKAKE